MCFHQCHDSLSYRHISTTDVYRAACSNLTSITVLYNSACDAQDRSPISDPIAFAVANHSVHRNPIALLHASARSEFIHFATSYPNYAAVTRLISLRRWYAIDDQ